MYFCLGLSLYRRRVPKIGEERLDGDRKDESKIYYGGRKGFSKRDIIRGRSFSTGYYQW